MVLYSSKLFPESPNRANQLEAWENLKIRIPKLQNNILHNSFGPLGTVDNANTHTHTLRKLEFNAVV